MGASMKDVARLANVSIATVSNVINKTRTVNPETKSKVLKAVRDLNYNVNPVARNLRNGSSKMIGFVVSDLANLFYIDIALSIDTVLRSQGYHLIYINSEENRERERDNIESLIMQNVDGLIIAPVGQDCSYMSRIIGDSCPSVFFDRPPIGYERDSILSTNYEGAYEGTELLLQRGHQRVGFIGSSLNETMEERVEGFRAALRNTGVTPDENLIRCGSGRPLKLSDQKGGDCFELARDLVEEKKVTALFCGNDLAAVGAVSYLKENRYAIPEDIAIACFDDMFWLSMATPAITAVDQDREAIGKTAAEILLNRIRQPEGPFKEYRVSTNLVVRSSC
jgi:LacI family transcriptional regulator